MAAISAVAELLVQKTDSVTVIKPSHHYQASARQHDTWEIEEKHSTATFDYVVRSAYLEQAHHSLFSESTITRY